GVVGGLEASMRALEILDWRAFLISGALLLGCAAPEGQPDHVTAVESSINSDNGLPEINGLSGNGLSGNGLSGNGLSGNGLSGNGLVMDALNANGLPSSTYLMNSVSGRSTVSYLFRCALPGNRSITKRDLLGASYTFNGQIGVAPEWETGTCDFNCQQQVTACMLAHVNTSGQHIM